MFWRLLRNLVLIGIGFGLVFVLPYTIYLDHQVRARFNDLRWQAPTRVYARSLDLRDGLPMSTDALVAELDAARYRKLAGAPSPGSWDRDGSRYTIARREQGLAVFTKASDWIVFGVIVLAARKK